MSLRWQNIVIDCTDTLLVASFWSEALGLELHGPEDGEYWIEPGGESPDILFLQVPEGKSVKDRIHLDLRPIRPRRWNDCSPSAPGRSTSGKARSPGS
jgi:hypothetical protein